MRFVLVPVGPSGSKKLVNLDHVASVEPASGNPEAASTVYFVDGSALLVTVQFSTLANDIQKADEAG